MGPFPVSMYICFAYSLLGSISYIVQIKIGVQCEMPKYYKCKLYVNKDRRFVLKTRKLEMDFIQKLGKHS